MAEFLACLFPALLALGFAVCPPSAAAKDYNIGQCPVAVNCSFSSLGNLPSTFNDTLQLYLGDWTESYGVYHYTSSQAVNVLGANNAPCYGRGCHYTVTIASATIDGVPLLEVNPYHWQLLGSLAPGLHTIAISGQASGSLYFARWGGSVAGIVYTLVPLPPCVGDECGGGE